MLAFERLLFKIKSDQLPKDYSLQPGAVIKHCDLVSTFNLLRSADEIKYFMNALCSAQNVTIKSNRKSYPINNICDLLVAVLCASSELSFTVLEVVHAFLKNNVLSKDQLTTLLKVLRTNHIENLLSTGCFEDEELLEIVNDIKLVNHLNIDTIRVLQLYFNPINAQQNSKTPILDMYYLANRAGHIFGLKNGVTLTISDMLFKMPTEFECASICLAYLTNFLALYCESTSDPIFNQIRDIFCLSKKLITSNENYYQAHAKSEFYKRYQQNELIYFSSGWHSHTIGLALYGDYLIYANKGEGSLRSGGCSIFRIKDRKLVTQEFIDELTSDYIQDQEKFYKILDRLCDLKNPVVTFKCKSQKYNTCSFVNPKSAIEAMIVLLQAGPDATTEQLQKVSLRESQRTKYRKFCTFIRDTEAKNLTKKMSCSNSPYLDLFYAVLLQELVMKHPGLECGKPKAVEEYKRNTIVLKRTPRDIVRNMTEDFLRRALKTYPLVDTTKVNVLDNPKNTNMYLYKKRKASIPQKTQCPLVLESAQRLGKLTISTSKL